jgi:hypothetical protein
VMEVVVFFLFATIEPHKKTIINYRCLLHYNRKKPRRQRQCCCCRLLCCNKTKIDLSPSML